MNLLKIQKTFVVQDYMAFNFKPITQVITQSFDLKMRSVLTCGEIMHPYKKGTGYKTQTILWDTGSTHSLLDEGVIKKLDLKPIGGTSKTKAVGGTIHTFSYYIDLKLNNDFLLYYRRVAGHSIKKDLGVDFIIGMDIIRQGDLQITTSKKKENKIFTFSMESIDRNN